MADQRLKQIAPAPEMREQFFRSVRKQKEQAPGKISGFFVWPERGLIETLNFHILVKIKQKEKQ